MRYLDLLLDFSPSPSGKAPYEVIVGAGEAVLFEDRAKLGAGLPFWPPGVRDEKPAAGDPEPNKGRRLPGGDTGASLWNALPDFVRASLSEQPGGGNVRRVKISSRSFAIGDLPWELLNDRSGRPPFAIRDGFQIARSVPIRLSAPPRIVEKPRVLIIVSQPDVKGAFDQGRELSSLVPLLERVGFRTEVSEQASVKALTESFRARPPEIVHFIGHAAVSRGAGYLVLERDASRFSDWVSGAQLAKLLPPTVGLLCLSSPAGVTNYQLLGFPRLAQTPSDSRLPSLVVSQFQAADPAASPLFWNTFYQSLRSREINGDINLAVASARKTVQENIGRDRGGIQPQNQDWATFALFIRDGGAQPFRFDQPHLANDPKRQADELEALFRARRVNDLAEQFKVLGPGGSKLIQREFEQQKQAVEAMSKGLAAPLPDR